MFPLKIFIRSVPVYVFEEFAGNFRNCLEFLTVDAFTYIF